MDAEFHSELDSLTLVTLGVGVEQKIEEIFKVRVELVNEGNMSEGDSPFWSAKALVDYLVQKLNGVPSV